MTNQEAIKTLSALLDFKGFLIVPDETLYEAIETAVAALSGGHLKVEITEIHRFAKPDDVNNVDFPGTGREDK